MGDLAGDRDLNIFYQHPMFWLELVIYLAFAFRILGHFGSILIYSK